MFERSAVDNHSHRQTRPTLVRISFADGNEATGYIEVSIQRGLTETLNGSATFIAFTPAEGEEEVIAISSIAAVRPIKLPKADQLSSRDRFMAEAAPHRILGLDADADREAIRAAYHRLSKVYHPDRYAGTALPKEVAEYLSAMARRLNVAYAALTQNRAATRPAEPASAEAHARSV